MNKEEYLDICSSDEFLQFLDIDENPVEVTDTKNIFKKVKIIKATLLTEYID